MEKNKSLFVEVFGEYPLIKVLDFLIENDMFDYSKKDICRNANISWNTLETFWGGLEKKEMVAFTRKIGRAELYRLNKKNPIVRHLVDFDKYLVKKSMEKIGTEKEKATALA